jgi:mono/diheme cytochrome c family protein
LALIASVAWAQGDVDKGKELWASHNCKSCHGANGEGQYAGPRAGDGKTAEEWVTQVRTPRNRMPSFRPEQISDADITDMWAYMQTLEKPASFERVTYTPQADDPPGKLHMANSNCIACHGNFGEGLVQNAFVNQGRDVTADVVMTQLRTPRNRMPSFSATQVSDEQAGQIGEFLASVSDRLKALMPVSGGSPPWRTPAGLISIGGLILIGVGVVLKTLRRRQTA